MLKVEVLLAHASKLVESGQWTPTAPTDDNRPKDEVLDHALRVAKKRDLDK